MAEAKKVKPLNIEKLRRDMRIIMDEIDRSGGVLPDAYSPLMWQRLQETTEKVADAIQAVRLTLSGMTCGEAAVKLGLETAQVAGYVAWNTMLQPDWVAPTDHHRRDRVPEVRSGGWRTLQLQ